MADCLIGLGSNVGERAIQLERAVHRLCNGPQISACATSTFHETVPVGGPSGQGPFLNAALRLVTEKTPAQLLSWARQVERELGRERVERWGPRSIDIDILLYDQLILQTPALTLPHPRMAVRRFVLQPACEVASDMIHAPTGWPLRFLLDRLDQPPCYVAVCCADPFQSAQLVTAAARQLGATRLSSGAVPARPREPTEPVLRSALTALAGQCELLESMTLSSQSDSLFLSDFWINQHLASSRTWPAGPARKRFQRACWDAVKRFPQPRFTVYLDVTAQVASQHHTQRSDTESAPSSMLRALAAELNSETAQSGLCPVLSVAAGNPNAALTELRAGIDAMR